MLSAGAGTDGMVGRSRRISRSRPVFVDEMSLCWGSVAVHHPMPTVTIKYHLCNAVECGGCRCHLLQSDTRPLHSSG